MKSFLVAASLLLASSAMYADLIPTLTGITPITTGPYTGDFSWNYTVSIGPDQAVVPAVGLAPGAMQAWPNFFSIIDFGSPTVFPISTPAGWGGSADTNAPNAFNVNAPNQAAISDIVMNYTGTTTMTGPMTISGFSFLATTNQEALGWYEGQGTKSTSGLANGTEQGNVGRVVVPYYSSGNLQQVPEPATFVLVGTGLIGLGFMRRRKA